MFEEFQSLLATWSISEILLPLLRIQTVAMDLCSFLAFSERLDFSSSPLFLVFSILRQSKVSVRQT